MFRQTFKNCCILSLLFVFINSSFSPIYSHRFIYVKWNAPGNNDGSSWQNAFNNLQDALNVSLEDDTIFVAAGIYYPDRVAGIESGDRNASFILKSGVVLMGGYKGVEELVPHQSSLNKYLRDWQNNKTILSGDLLDNDNENISPDEITRSDNSIHVIGTNNPVDSTAEINGFYIEGGNANSIENFVGARGGAIYISSSSLQIKNCLFRNNSSLESGGAVFSNTGELIIKHVTFENNSAKSGGAISFIGPNNLNEPSHPKIINSFFYNNKSEENGGAILALNSADLILINNVFTSNSTTIINSSGGGIYADDKSYPQIINCTFYKNLAQSFGGAASFSAAIISNSIFRNNIAATSKEIYINGPPANPDAANEIKYSSIEGGFSGTQIYDFDPLFVDADNPAGNDNFFGTPDDGLILLSNSPAEDTASSDLNNYQSDINGFPRLSKNNIDLGAYESQRYEFDYEDLFEILTTGSNTLLFIHALTVPEEFDDPYFANPSDVNDSLFIYNIHDCTLQKNLSDEGFTQARYIGDAVRFLEIEHDVVIASPMCRTKVTAREIFGLGSFLTSYSWMWADPKYTNSKKTRLGTIKEQGINSVLITHPDNIAEVTDFNEAELAEGDLVIIKPLGGMNYEVLAHLTTDTWEKLFKYIYSEPTDINDAKNNIQGYVLFDNYPNPFNPTTTIEFQIPVSGHVSLKIYDVLGGEVSSLLNEVRSAGNYKIHFDASNLASGIYYYKLETGDFNQTKKLILMK